MIIIDHIDIVLGINDQICRAVELAVTIAGFAPDIKKIPARIEFADPIFLPIRDIHIALRIGCDPTRIGKEIVRAAACAPLCQEIAFGIELLDARVAAIGDIEPVMHFGLERARLKG
jgi:hypothetical protein